MLPPYFWENKMKPASVYRRSSAKRNDFAHVNLSFLEWPFPLLFSFRDTTDTHTLMYKGQTETR